MVDEFANPLGDTVSTTIDVGVATADPVIIKRLLDIIDGWARKDADDPATENRPLLGLPVDAETSVEHGATCAWEPAGDHFGGSIRGHRLRGADLRRRVRERRRLGVEHAVTT